MAVEWLIGVAINIVGATTTNLGTVLMKYHTAKLNNQGIWKRVGVGLFVLGSILTFVSFSFAAQSLLAGISAIQFVTNLFFAHYFLGEDYTKHNMLGTLVLISAIAMLVVASDKSNVAADVNQFFDDYYFTKTHLIFIVAILSGVATLATAFWFRTGVVPFWLQSDAAEKRLILELSLPRSHSPATKILAPSAFVCLSAMIGAQSVVSGKVLSLIMSRSVSVGNFYEFKLFRSYVVLALWLGCALFWVVHLSRAMRVFHGAFIIPLTQVCWTLWTMISGGVVYGEFTDIASWRIAMFTIGAAALFGGVALLAPVYAQHAPASPERSHTVSREVSGEAPSRSNGNGHSASGQLHKLMTCLSVDEMAATNDAKSSSVLRHSQTIVFDESLSSPITDPPYLRFRRWRRARHPPAETSRASSSGNLELAPYPFQRQPLSADAGSLVSGDIVGNSRI